jgi:hypothetical protein
MHSVKSANFLSVALLCKTIKDVITNVERKNESGPNVQLLDASGKLDKIIINNVVKRCNTSK